ncbi:scavenger receptor cysteine-rich domain-containing protein DMBT1-like [Hemitrygon akajei]|uniref:scavenger receptor cysteine-rich domain-containing protein DMBT1-like n=1 Tax=Hemitrygon akajei TaxID=2704970 RepID=UPI003BFA25C6
MDFCAYCAYMDYGYCGVPATEESTLIWETTAGSCGGYLYESYGSFVSPAYPSSYPNYASCIWYIRVNSNQKINLQFTDFDLEANSGCTYDYVAIYDGPSTNDPLLARICSQPSETYTSLYNSMTIYFRTDGSVTQQGFSANYHSLPINDETTPIWETTAVPCGGYLYESYGSLVSPAYPSSYPNNANCIWYIRVNSNQKINLQFTDFNLEANSGCTYDYVAIYDGPSTNDPLLARICSQPSETYTSLYNSMTIYFRTDGSVTRQGFSANYHSLPINDETTPIWETTAVPCGGYLYESYGSLVSPAYPSSYPNNANCIWYIRVNSNQKINLQFTDFNLEANSGCTYDYVAIYDGPSTNDPLLARICSQPSETYTSLYNSMTIYFRTDGSVTQQGFSANYHSLPINDETTPIWETTAVPCGGYLYESYGSLVSPAYPSSYPNNANCIWYIRVNSNQKINLQFTDFNLEANSGCTYDYVAIYDGPSTNDPLLARICSQPSETYTSLYNSMTIYFRTDGSVTQQGFSANYHSLPINDETTPIWETTAVPCGGYLYESYGSLVSPAYPSSYPNNANCIWYIRVNSNQKINLQFTDFNLEANSGCTYDYVAIYDGPSTNDPLLARICSQPNETYTSLYNSMTIYFRTDGSVTQQGFSANYHSLPINDETTPIWETTAVPCGGYLYESYGSLVSPAYPSSYPNNANCIWYIRVNSNQKINLQFTDFNLEANSGCTYDYVAIYDGPSTNDPLLARICSQPSETYTSLYNSMTIYFRTDGSVTQQGFSANYHSLPINDETTPIWETTAVPCGGYLYESYGSLVSPAYPSSYPNNANCIWYIRVNSNQKINLQFTDFNLEANSGCTYDYVAIYDGPSTNDPLLARICSQPNETYTSLYNSMTIYFRTDGSVTQQGFSANYHSLPINDGELCEIVPQKINFSLFKMQNQITGLNCFKGLFLCEHLHV